MLLPPTQLAHCQGLFLNIQEPPHIHSINVSNELFSLNLNCNLSLLQICSLTEPVYFLN
jgi:hypothetical protein